jgi:hypothetical protein
MGWCEMEHKWGNEPCIILHQGARSRGYKHCEGARARESEREREGPALLIFSRPFVVRLLISPAVRPCVRTLLVCSYALPRLLCLDIPFYRHKEMTQLYNGV